MRIYGGTTERVPHGSGYLETRRFRWGSTHVFGSVKALAPRPLAVPDFDTSTVTSLVLENLLTCALCTIQCHFNNKDEHLYFGEADLDITTRSPRDPECVMTMSCDCACKLGPRQALRFASIITHRRRALSSNLAAEREVLEVVSGSAVSRGLGC